MRNKNQCRRCKYRGGAMDAYNIICNYAFIADQTCLHRENGKIVDRRGTDPNNCLCFEEGRVVNEKGKDEI